MREMSEGGTISNRRRFLQSTALAAGIVTTANAGLEDPAAKRSNRTVPRDRWSEPFNWTATLSRGNWGHTGAIGEGNWEGNWGHTTMARNKAIGGNWRQDSWGHAAIAVCNPCVTQ